MIEKKAWGKTFILENTQLAPKKAVMRKKRTKA